MGNRESFACPYCGAELSKPMALNYTIVRPVKTHRAAIDWIENKTGMDKAGQTTYDKSSWDCSECGEHVHYVQRKTD